MPEGFSIGVPSNILEQLGQYKAAAKEVQAEIAKVRRDAALLEKEGKAVPKNISQRISSLEDRRMQLLAKDEARNASQKQMMQLNDRITAVHGAVMNVASGNLFTTSGMLSVATLAATKGSEIAPSLLAAKAANDSLKKNLGNLGKLYGQTGTGWIGKDVIGQNALRELRNVNPKQAEALSLWLGTRGAEKVAGFMVPRAAAIAGGAEFLGQLTSMAGLGSIGIAGSVGYGVGSLGMAIVGNSETEAANRARANKILQASQNNLTDFLMQNRYTSSISAGKLANLQRYSRSIYNYHLGNTWGMGILGNQNVMAAQAQEYDDQMAMFAIRYGSKAASQFALDNIERNSKNVQLQLDRGRGRDVSTLNALGAVVGYFNFRHSRDEFDLNKHALWGKIGLVGEKIRWLFTLGYSDAEAQERRELALKEGKTVSEGSIKARERKQAELDSRPERHIVQMQRSIHLRAVEEMKINKFMQWNTY